MKIKQIIAGITIAILFASTAITGNALSDGNVIQEEPIPTQDPAATEEPMPTKEPVPTEGAESTEVPAATKEPIPAEEPESTEEPLPTEEPIPVEEPEAEIYKETLPTSSELSDIGEPIYKVTFPTSGDLSFVLDAMGLYGYFNDPANSGTSPVMDDLAPYAGRIIGKSQAVIKNESSVPIIVKCSFFLTVDEDIVVINGEVNPDAKEMALRIEPLVYNTSEDIALPDSQEEYDNAIYVSSTDRRNQNSIYFGLDAADYEWSVNGSNAAAEFVLGSEECIAFQVGGSLSKNAVWKDAKVLLNCVYSYQGMEDAELDDLPIADDGTGVIEGY